MASSRFALDTILKTSLMYFILLRVGVVCRTDAHECFRTCEWPPNPMICRYEFTVEWYYSMSTSCFDCPYNMTDCTRPHCIPINGVPRGIVTINRQFPGPSIQVCEFDTIEVKVNNEMINEESITIHWHGIHQRGTPYMDGVPLVTQCHIPYRSSFTYRFQAETFGTHFWHAHGMARSNGAVGSLVIRQAAPAEIHNRLYDYDLQEHVIIMQDWVNQLMIDRFTRIVYGDLELAPDSMLINGKGRYREFIDESSNQSVYTPREVFHVQRGNTYRFRTISNNLMDCLVEVSIDHHNLTIIASDGAPLQPVEAGAYGMSSGERFDFILDASAEIGKYWMRIKGRDCHGFEELALLVYEGAADQPDPPEVEQPYPSEVIVNPFNRKSSEYVKNIIDLSAAVNGTEQVPVPEADETHYMVLELELINNNDYNHPMYNPAFGVKGDLSTYKGVPSPQINRVSFKYPSSPLLTQYQDLSDFEMCSTESVLAYHQERCKNEHCVCTQVLHVELGKVVEIVLVDQGNFRNAHAMHIHGYRFQVVAQDTLGEETTLEEVKRLDRAGNITRRTHNVPHKDTVAPLSGGYVIVRFVADNPGWWLFHCHVSFHFTAGMTMVIRVGSDKDLPPVPRNFPRCGGDWHQDDIGSNVPIKPAPTPNSASYNGRYPMLSLAVAGCAVSTMIVMLA
ncbi:laccase-5-like [Asterias rubens]|uniref:laccase-5-like n=1 Tax=Asterias rubens TaxID=7604 RepID=UPI0014551282|nr:laccase-5-like [Asterias rubens]